MSGDSNKPRKGLTRWRAGEPLSAKHLQESVDAINQLTSGVRPPRQKRHDVLGPRLARVYANVGCRDDEDNCDVSAGTGEQIDFRGETIDVPCNSCLFQLATLSWTDGAWDVTVADEAPVQMAYVPYSETRSCQSEPNLCKVEPALKEGVEILVQGVNGFWVVLGIFQLGTDECS